MIVSAITESESQLLSEMALNAPTGPILEIGCDRGFSTLILSRIAGQKGIRFFAVDHFGWGTRQQFVANREQYKIEVELIEEDSHDPKTAERFEDESLALLFIDGDHLEEGIKADLEVWLPKLMKGGILVCHDYGCSTYPGIERQVKLFTGDWPWESICGTMVAKIKPW